MHDVRRSVCPIADVHPLGNWCDHGCAAPQLLTESFCRWATFSQSDRHHLAGRRRPDRPTIWSWISRRRFTPSAAMSDRGHRTTSQPPRAAPTASPFPQAEFPRTRPDVQPRWLERLRPPSPAAPPGPPASGGGRGPSERFGLKRFRQRRRHRDPPSRMAPAKLENRAA
jgi:hypothetical protein